MYFDISTLGPLQTPIFGGVILSHMVVEERLGSLNNTVSALLLGKLSSTGSIAELKITIEPWVMLSGHKYNMRNAEKRKQMLLLSILLTVSLSSVRSTETLNIVEYEHCRLSSPVYSDQSG